MGKSLKVIISVLLICSFLLCFAAFSPMNSAPRLADAMTNGTVYGGFAGLYKWQDPGSGPSPFWYGKLVGKSTSLPSEVIIYDSLRVVDAKDAVPVGHLSNPDLRVNRCTMRFVVDGLTSTLLTSYDQLGVNTPDTARYVGFVMVDEWEYYTQSLSLLSDNLDFSFDWGEWFNYDANAYPWYNPMFLLQTISTTVNGTVKAVTTSFRCVPWLVTAIGILFFRVEYLADHNGWRGGR